MGESLYGSGNYGVEEYSFSIYIPLSGGSAVSFALSADLIRRVGLYGDVAVAFTVTPPELERLGIINLRGVVSVNFVTPSSPLTVDYNMGGAIELSLETSPPNLNQVANFEGVTGVTFNTVVPDMYGGPYWVDDVPVNVEWTPISAQGY
jgi:hypothetical protein